MIKNLKAEDLELDINQKEGRGLTALDFACELQDEEIIKRILAIPTLTLPKDSYAKAIYNQLVSEKIFESFLAGIKRNGIGKEIPEHGYPSLYIFMQEPYSDMIYFMKDICVNLGFLSEKSFPAFDGMTSHDWFCQCFEIGYKVFCEKRNHIPVNSDLLNTMMNQENLEAWRDKALLVDRVQLKI